MKRLLHALRWEIRIALRRGLYLPALLLSGVAAGTVSVYRCFQPPDALAGLACGYLVLAVYLPLARLIRSEKSDGILIHLNLSPLRPHEYLASKLALGLFLGVPGGALVMASAPGPWTAPLAALLGLVGGSALMVLVAFVSMAPTGSARGACLAGLAALAVLGFPLAWELRHPWLMSWAGAAQLLIWLLLGLALGKVAYGQARVARPEGITGR